MATNVTKKRKKQQRQAAFRLLILVAILVCVNMLASRFHYGIDLTREKRFTLSDATKKMLENMEDVAVVTVYLEGDNFPAGFQRLKEATRERLQSFREFAGTKIIYSFTDPTEGKNHDEKMAVYAQLADKGMTPINLQVQGDEDGYSERYILPWALVQYNGQEMPVRLLENRSTLSAWDNLNYSENILEYKFANAINKLKLPAKPEIAYITGNGESLGMNTYDLLTSLQQQYDVDTIDLINSLYIPRLYKAIIINKPTEAFDDRDKFKIDQYIMNGGNVLWAIDMLNTPMDSLRASQQFITTDYGLNLDDQLFKYGVRINTNLVEDVQQCLPLPIMVEDGTGKPQMQLRPWIYFPLFIPSSKHSIVNNMDAVMGMYVNSIDTAANPEISKTILLESSKYSRVTPSPARVSLSILKYPPNPDLFNNPYQPVAVLLEGKFKSVFDNRLHPRFLHILRDSLNMAFKREADTTGRMIVISDGNMLENDFSQSMGPMEMGYWQYTKDLFANKTFVLNCIEYLTDDAGLLEARSKDVRLRLLDTARVKDERTMWQAVNIGIPIALVLIFASAYLFFRKRRYEKRA